MQTSAFTQLDADYMAEALQLALRGLYSAAPNPRVGCVIVKDAVIIGRGWHKKSGGNHAEVNAIEDAVANGYADQLSGATAYVSLEPCAHHGKTPPCSQALIAANLARVVYAMDDPNPMVCGLGKKMLLSAGVDVAVGLMNQQAVNLNKGFVKRHQTGLPFVMCKVAMSLDGATAMSSGESQWITSDLARAKVQEYRAASCAIITGIGTVLHDDPLFTVRNQSLPEQDIRQPSLVVVDSQLKIPLSAKVLASSVSRSVIIACSKQADQSKKSALQDLGVEVVELSLDDGLESCSVDLLALLKFLAAKDINEVLVESGSVLAGAFLQQQLIDEIKYFIAPKIMGSNTKAVFNLPFESLSEAISIDIKSISHVGCDLLVEGVPLYEC